MPQQTGGASRQAWLTPWRRNDPATAETDERTAPVLVSTQRTRLTGLGAAVANLGTLVAEDASTDRDGNETAAKTYFDSATKTVVRVTESPFSTTDVTTTTVNGLLREYVSASNLTTHYLYDDLGRQIGTTDPRISGYDEQTGSWSNYRQTHYNALGQVEWTSDTAGNQTTYAYDNPPADPTDAQRQEATGRRIAVTTALGKTKRMAYTVRGQLHRVWGDTEYPLEYGYDVIGHPTTLKTYRGGTGWNGTDWPTATAGTADTTTWSYEPATGLLESKEYADGKGPSYAYHTDGSLATRTWARTVGGNALVTTYTYDSGTGQLTGVDYSDSTADISYTYTRTGGTKTVTDATGTRTFAYTDKDKLHSETLPSSFYGAAAVLTRSCDTLGRDDGYSLSYGGTAIQAPAYGHDTYGRFISLTEGTDTFTYAYLANSDLLSTLSGPASMVQTRAYESTRDLVDYVENKIGATTVSKYDYTNDTIGRRTGVQKSGTAFTTTDTIAWGYDDRSQVTSAVAANDPNYDYSYAYDPIGNRTTSVTKETGTPVTTGYTSSQLNQYTAITGRTDPTYDDDGNMTLLPAAAGDWTLAWDGENRLVSAESSSARLEFLYDYMGRRVEKMTYAGTTGDWTLSETRRFLYDGWNLIAEFVVDGETVSLDRAHLWGLDLSGSLQGEDGVGGLLRTSEHGATVAAYYPDYDANGNVSEYLDSAGSMVAHYEYSPFGRTTVATGTKAADFPFRFSTRFLDSAFSLYLYGHLYYSPSLARGISRGFHSDPAGGDGVGLGQLLWILGGSYSLGPGAGMAHGLSIDFVQPYMARRKGDEQGDYGWATCDPETGKVETEVNDPDPTGCLKVHEDTHKEQLSSCCKQQLLCRMKALEKGDKTGVRRCWDTYKRFQQPLKKNDPHECGAVLAERSCLRKFRDACRLSEENPNIPCPYTDTQCEAAKKHWEETRELRDDHCKKKKVKICEFGPNGELPPEDPKDKRR